MAIVTMPRMNVLHIIKMMRIGKVRIGWVIARIREKISVPRCYRCSAFGHLSHYCDKGNNTTKPSFLCGATNHLATTCRGVDYRHRSRSAKCTALAKAKERRLRKGNG